MSSKSKLTNAMSRRKNTWSPYKQLASVPPCMLATLLYPCVKTMTIMRRMNRMRTYHLRASLSIQFHVVVNLCCLYTIVKQLEVRSFYQDHIVEVGSMVIAPDGVSISNDEFSSLCHTSRHIARKGLFFLI